MTRPGRVALIAVVAILAIIVLFTVVFPWVDRHLIADPVMEGSAPGTPAAPGMPAELNG